MKRTRNGLARWLVCATTSLVMLVFTLMIVGCSGVFSTAEGVATKAEMAVVENQPNAYMECLCPAYVECMVNDWGFTEEELMDELGDDNYENVGKSFEADCGPGFRAEYKVTNVEAFDSSDYSKIVKDLVNYFDYNEGSIQDLKRVEVATNAAGSRGTATWSGKYSCVKYNGAWYVHRPGFDV